MTGLPTVQVLLDDGTGTFPYDVTAYARNYEVTRGRPNEFDGIQPSQLRLLLENKDGRFTLGDPTYGCRTDQAIRVLERFPTVANTNLLSAAAASFESGVGSWSSGGSVLPTRAVSLLHPVDGVQSMLVTWGTAGTLPLVSTVATGLTIGKTYTYSAYVWVPTGSPGILLSAVGGFSSVTNVKDTTVRLTRTFVATATSHSLQVWPATAPTAGQTVYVDAVMLNEGSVAGDFNILTPLTRARFTGYVDDWPLEWSDATGQMAMCQVTARDRRARFDRRKLRSTLEQEILLDAPVAYYTLGEPTGATAAGETSGRGGALLTQAGTGTAVAFGAGTGPGIEPLPAPGFAGRKYLAGGSVTFTAGESVTLGCWFRSTTSSVTLLRVAGWELGLDSAGNLYGFGRGTAYGAGGTDLTDGQLHFAVLTCTPTSLKVYQDGVLAASVSGGGLTTTSHITVGGSELSGAITVTGVIAHAFYCVQALSGARVAEHYAAGSTGFEDESSDSRVARLASYAGLTVADLNLEAGVLESMPVVPISGSTVGGAMDDVITAEGGTLFFAGDGKLTMQNRNHRVITATSTAQIALDSGDVDPGDFTISGDKTYLQNYITGSRDQGATQIVSDQASIDRHEQYPEELTNLHVNTDAEVLSRIQWQVYKYSEVKPRIASATIDLTSLPLATVYAVFASELGDRLTIANLPSQRPSAFVPADLLVEGTVEKVDIDGGWSVTVNTAPADLFQAFILDDPVWGVLDSTTPLYY
ncbi:LamG-like jellyroll fold domain-containing protein [Nocardioides sp. URHA0020]|uniref:LamG-like jellyroll fold domain-containing protein n=1 Tax=Nocardioides sp. URHA0020 TaxID=1380392 RepID=UPI00048F9AFD|nr:LamG-like jellyroll fold domain-containing protein [Nocardioides sp. URHA0020]